MRCSADGDNVFAAIAIEIGNNHILDCNLAWLHQRAFPFFARKVINTNANISSF